MPAGQNGGKSEINFARQDCVYALLDTIIALYYTQEAAQKRGK